VRLTEKEENLLVIQDLVKHFKTSHGVVRAIDGINFNVKVGETFGLVGESGSGKSTTGYVTMGIYTPTSGKVIFRDKDISVHVKKRPKDVKKEMAIVFQDPASSLNSTKTIRDIIGLPLKIHKMVKNNSEVDKRVTELLEAVELPSEDFKQRRPRDLGGGERQAVAIARAIATNPALDVSIQAKIMQVLMKLQKELNLSYLFITHDLSLMRNVSSRVAIMYLAQIVEYAPTTIFFKNPTHPYTKMLLSSVPVLTKDEEQLKPKGIPSRGEVPSAINPPLGCRFHTRCPIANQTCRTKQPAFIMLEPDHYVACHMIAK
jgi:oligopeptide/dipeptide ABC transporter ATP-binding protein